MNRRSCSHRTLRAIWGSANWGFFAPLLFFGLLFASPAAHGQISPGPLSKAHQSLNGPTQCTSCHAVGRGSAALKCNECHTEIAQELTQNHGLHAHFPNRETCATCHSEHNGEEFSLIHWLPSLREFDHKQTGYPLEGKHASVECSQCHAVAHISPQVRPLIKIKEPNKSFLGLSQECTSCHTDPHKGQLGANCLQCHNFNDWKTANKIDHNKTRFPLTGLHAQVACAKCHTPAVPGGPPRFTGIPFSKCADCHNDPHRGTFAQTCEGCHTTSSWKKIPAAEKFDHSKTSFPLLGKHADVDCLACHQGGNFRKPVAFARCADCHTPDPHGGQFSARRDKGACESCHTVDGWKPSLFGVKAHGDSAYPLTGRHFDVPCAKCHIPAGAATRYKISFSTCTDCHQDAHGGQFAQAPYKNRCEECHTVAGFRPSTYTIAQHQKTRFRLAGAHLAVTCAECHTNRPEPGLKGASYRFADLSCSGCHKDPHHGQFDSQMAQKRPADGTLGCEACHSLKSWTDLPGFDHSKTSFALAGAHSKVPCEDCHKPTEPGGKISEVSFRSAPTICTGCHEDIHAGQFTKAGRPRKCEDCHNAERWRPSLFDHEKQTDFSLKGAHKDVACDLCHKGVRTIDGKRVVTYKPTPRQCADCH